MRRTAFLLTIFTVLGIDLFVLHHRTTLALAQGAGQVGLADSSFIRSTVSWRKVKEGTPSFEGVPLDSGEDRAYYGLPNENDEVPLIPLEKKQSYDPRPHVVFMIHGLLAAESTFGHLENIIKKEIGPYRNIKTKNLTYPTVTNSQSITEYELSKDLHPYDFARIINSKIISYMVEKGLSEIKSCRQEVITGRKRPFRPQM